MWDKVTSISQTYYGDKKSCLNIGKIECKFLLCVRLVYIDVCLSVQSSCNLWNIREMFRQKDSKKNMQWYEPFSHLSAHILLEFATLKFYFYLRIIFVSNVWKI
ncbi:hypothetical protein ACP275_04G057900 [Erythranthe tilingii]